MSLNPRIINVERMPDIYTRTPEVKDAENRGRTELLNPITLVSNRHNPKTQLPSHQTRNGYMSHNRSRLSSN